MERGKTAITNLISLLNEYNQVIKTNNSHQIQPIINKLAPIFTTSNGGRSNIYHKLGGLSSLNTYMQIRKIRTKYYLGNTEISKDDITVFLPYFIGNNNIKSTNLESPFTIALRINIPEVTKLLLPYVNLKYEIELLKQNGTTELLQNLNEMSIGLENSNHTILEQIERNNGHDTGHLLHDFENLDLIGQFNNYEI